MPASPCHSQEETALATCTNTPLVNAYTQSTPERGAGRTILLTTPSFSFAGTLTHHTTLTHHISFGLSCARVLSLTQMCVMLVLRPDIEVQQGGGSSGASDKRASQECFATQRGKTACDLIHLRVLGYNARRAAQETDEDNEGFLARLWLPQAAAGTTPPH